LRFGREWFQKFMKSYKFYFFQLIIKSIQRAYSKRGH
jgi:hypothetical protein